MTSQPPPFPASVCPGNFPHASPSSEATPRVSSQPADSRRFFLTAAFRGVFVRKHKLHHDGLKPFKPSFRWFAVGSRGFPVGRGPGRAAPRQSPPFFLDLPLLVRFPHDCKVSLAG